MSLRDEEAAPVMEFCGLRRVEVCAACPSPRRRGCHLYEGLSPGDCGRPIRGSLAIAQPRPPPTSSHDTPCCPRVPCVCPLAPVLGRLTKQNVLQHSRLSATAADIQHGADYAETIAKKNFLRQLALPQYLPCPVPACPPGRLKPEKSSVGTRKAASYGPAQAARKEPLGHTCHCDRKRVAARLQDTAASFKWT